MGHLWAVFLDLHSTREVGFAAGPISFREIESYARLTGVTLTPWEVGVIRAVDAAVLETASNRSRKDGGSRDSRNRS
jgi:hypothetical protein